MGVFDSDTTVEIAVDRLEFHPGDSVNVRVAVGGASDPRVQGAESS